MESEDAVAVLGEPVRRELYRFVARVGREVGRGEAAEAVGVQRTLAAFHLDKLVEAGLLEAGFRQGERKGPGSGRPAKVYRRARTEHLVSLPPRDYRTLALILAEVVDLVGAEDLAQEAARKVGRRLARPPGGDVETLLEGHGYEPYEQDGVLRLRNCPFHVIAEDQPELVCGMNLALCEGMVEDSGWTARLDPRPGECCVTLSKNNEN